MTTFYPNRMGHLFSLTSCLLSTAFTLLISVSLGAQEHLFVVERGAHRITSVPLNVPDPTPKIETAQGLLNPYDLILDASSGSLFWTDGINRQIIRGEAADLSAQISPPFQPSVAVDLELDALNNKLYWADNAGRRIFRANPDGSEQEAVPAVALSSLSAIALLPSLDMLFYADLDSQSIWSCTLSGDKQAVVVEDVAFPVRLLADPVGGKLYWASDGEHLIERSNLDGSGREVFYQGAEEEYPFGLFLDQGNRLLYWTDYGTDRVMRSRVDDAGAPELVADNLSDPVGIVILDKSGFKGDKSQDRQAPADKKPRLALYPNPANRLVVFSSLEQGQAIEWLKVFDATGKQVYDQIIGAGACTLDIQTFPEGYYSYSARIMGHLISGHFSIIH